MIKEKKEKENNNMQKNNKKLDTSSNFQEIKNKNEINEKDKNENEVAILVKKAIEGDEEAFSKLINKYKNKIYKIIYFMVKNEEDTLDLLQETFIKVYQSLKTLRNYNIFEKWMIKIAINLTINYLKKKDRRNKYYQKIKEENIKLENKTTDTYNPLDVLEQKELQELLYKLIDKLPPKQKTVLILCDIEGYSYKEIAEIVDCNIGTVMSRLFYAREFIRKYLKENYFK